MTQIEQLDIEVQMIADHSIQRIFELVMRRNNKQLETNKCRKHDYYDTYCYMRELLEVEEKSLKTYDIATKGDLENYFTFRNLTNDCYDIWQDEPCMCTE